MRTKREKKRAHDNFSDFSLGGIGTQLLKFSESSGIRPIFSVYQNFPYFGYILTSLTLRHASLFLIFHISPFPKVVELGLSFQFTSPHIMGTF